MALAVADRVKETSTTAGTGTLTLLGAVSGYQSFSVIGSGNTTYYCIVDDNTGAWEVGVGTYTSPNQLSRDTVLSSSSGGSAITFLGNIKQVFVTYPAERSVYENAAGSLVLTKVEATTGIITNLTSTSAVLTNVSATSATVTNLTLTSLTLSNLSIASANITTLTSASATITNLLGTTLTISGNSFLATSSGNVGIGTASPQSKLNVVDSSSSTSIGGSTAVLQVGNSYGAALNVSAGIELFGSGAPSSGLNNRSAGLYGVYEAYNASGNAGALVLATNPAGTTSVVERMRIDSSGNVGIGAATGAARLLVQGAGTSTTAGGNVVGRFQTNGSGYDASIQLSDNVANSAVFSMVGGAINFISNGSNYMNISAAGNVGIGTASPVAKLQSAGTSGSAQFRAGTASNGYFEINAFDSSPVYCVVGGSNATAGVFGTQSNIPSIFFTNNTERMRLDTSGNLGIGVTPSANTTSKLFNAGDFTRVGGSGGYLFNLYYSSTNARWEYAGTGTGAGWIDSGSGNYTFQSTGSTSGTAGAAATALAERMRIDSSGNVGIGGTADAFAKVHVLGTLPTSSQVSIGFRQTGTVPSGTTNTAYGYNNNLFTQAASFTLSNYHHFFAYQNTIGAGSSITNQYGYFVDATLTGATNNYGFYSDIASGSNRWNFYAAGTAQNYFAGRLGIGNTTFVDSEMLRITQASAKQALFIDITAASSTAYPGVAIRKYDNDNTTAQTYVTFAYNNGANGAGGIQGNGGTGPQFYNSSDARLKENVADLDGQLAKIMALKPRTFDFIDGPKNCTGFIAQEMEQVYPDAVGVDKDGYKTIGGVSIMEARLIKAIQELSAKVAALEAK